MKDMRAEFEAWAASIGMTFFNRDKHDRYTNDVVYGAWQGYQAALTASAKQIIQDDIAQGIHAHWSRNDISGNGKESAVPAQEPDYNDIQLAEMIMSDCGLSTLNSQSLVERIACRIAKHIAQQPAQEPVAYRVGKYLTENKKAAEFEASEFSLPLEPLYTQEPVARIDKMKADFSILQKFHTKHALGSMLAPSCLCCGQRTHPYTRPVAIQHLELPAMVICKQCKDASQSQSAIAEPVKQESWISVEEAKTTLKDGDPIFAYSKFYGVIEATYDVEEGYYNPHRVVKDNGDSYRINTFTHIMKRQIQAMPLPPVEAKA